MKKITNLHIKREIYRHSLLLLNIALISLYTVLGTSCSVKEPSVFQKLDTYPAIFPDYVGVTIPSNISPLRFKLKSEVNNAVAIITRGTKKLSIASSEGAFLIDESDWEDLLEDSEGDSLQVKVYQEKGGKWELYKPFTWYVAAHQVDPFLVYRLIEPGYELWNEMGIYQRNLTTFDEDPILTNKRTDNNCMNCHTFNKQSPDTILFHQRAKNGGTYLATADKVEKLDPKFKEKFNGIVYPSWHPSGKIIAFSSNKIRQAFARSHRNRVEVYDLESDIVFYDVARHELFSDSLLVTKHAFETFPNFSPDGKKLYFCLAQAVIMPEKYEDVHYSLCSVDFDAETRKIGSKIDTLVSVDACKKSVSFPRASPDGKSIVFVLSDFGNFSIWHREADLYSLDLQTGKIRALDEINSNETESFHTWSSNGRWMVFSSRRIDGLYTHPHLAYLKDDGTFGRPFVIPQENPDFYHYFMKSFNLPELLKGKVEIDKSAVWKATREKGIKLKWIEGTEKKN